MAMFSLTKKKKKEEEFDDRFPKLDRGGKLVPDAGFTPLAPTKVYRSEAGSLVPGGSEPMPLPPLRAVPKAPAIKQTAGDLKVPKVETEISEPEPLLKGVALTEQKGKAPSEWDTRLDSILGSLDVSKIPEEDLAILEEAGVHPLGENTKRQVYGMLNSEPTIKAYNAAVDTGDIDLIKDAYENIDERVKQIKSLFGDNLDDEYRGDVLPIYKRNLRNIAYDEKMDPKTKRNTFEAYKEKLDPAIIDANTQSDINQMEEVIKGDVINFDVKKFNEKTEELVKEGDLESLFNLRENLPGSVQEWVGDDEGRKYQVIDKPINTAVNRYMGEFNRKAKNLVLGIDRMRNQEYAPELGHDYVLRMVVLKDAYESIDPKIQDWYKETKDETIEDRKNEILEWKSKDLTNWKMDTYNEYLSFMRNQVYSGERISPKVYRAWENIVNDLTNADEINLANQGKLPGGSLVDKVNKDRESLSGRKARTGGTAGGYRTEWTPEEIYQFYLRTFPMGEDNRKTRAHYRAKPPKRGKKFY